MNVWAVTYDFRGQERTIIVETEQTTVAAVKDHLHPAIATKVVAIEFVGALA